MVEVIPSQQPGQHGLGPDAAMMSSSQNDILQQKAKPTKKINLLQIEQNKLPISLCRKPNRQTMQDQEYEDCIREMLENRIYLHTEEERQAFGHVVRQGVPASLRADMWNLFTGVYMYKHGYVADYYQTLHAALASEELKHYPNAMFEKYRRDISRAFPGDTFYTAEIKESIARIIEAYIWRNPTVGYIQGFNFLVFRLRKVLDEEDTFWTLVMIIETYMPPDYYVEMYGVRTQASILQKIFRQYSFLPAVQAKFDDPAIQFNLMDNAISWFISLYTECLPEQASLQVLDLFFLHGQKNNKVIFDVALGYLKTLQNQITAAEDLGVLKNEVFDEKNDSLKDTELLMQEITSSMHALKQEHIDFYRPVCQKEAVDYAQEIKFSAYTRFKKVRDQYKDNPEANVDKIRKQFLEMFNLFEGELRDRMKSSYRDPVATFKCDHDWPMCAFNFSKKHVIPETFTFKSGDYDEILIYPNYFSPQAIEFQEQKEEEPSSLTNIVIERDQHYCKANLFVNTFASLYVNKRKQSRLFKCKQLAIKKNMTQIESHRKMMKFVTFIRDQKLSDRERIKMDKVKVIRDETQIKYHDTIRGEETKVEVPVIKPSEAANAHMQDEEEQKVETQAAATGQAQIDSAGKADARKKNILDSSSESENY